MCCIPIWRGSDQGACEHAWMQGIDFGLSAAMHKTPRVAARIRFVGLFPLGRRQGNASNDLWLRNL